MACARAPTPTSSSDADTGDGPDHNAGRWRPVELTAAARQRPAGTLADGTAASPVVVTSLHDDSASGRPAAAIRRRMIARCPGSHPGASPVRPPVSSSAWLAGRLSDQEDWPGGRQPWPGIGQHRVLQLQRRSQRKVQHTPPTLHGGSSTEGQAPRRAQINYSVSRRRPSAICRRRTIRAVRARHQACQMSLSVKTHPPMQCSRCSLRRPRAPAGPRSRQTVRQTATRRQSPRSAYERQTTGEPRRVPQASWSMLENPLLYFAAVLALWEALKHSKNLIYQVELWGFEPQTSCMPCKTSGA